MTPLALLLALAGATTPAAPAIDPATRAAIEATCLDYVDGQLEGDPARVARSLHPDLAKRAILGDTPDERLGLRRSPRIAVEDDAVRGIRLVEPLTDDARHDLVRNKTARFHHRLRLKPDRGPGGDRCTQHVARRKLHHAALADERGGLGALARARRSKKDDIHETHSPRSCRN